MKPTFFILRQLGLAFLLTVVAFPAACAPGNKTKIVKWQEEVKLSTGEVIVVERETRFKGGGDPFQGAADTMTIRFRYPPDAKEVIEWRTIRHASSGGGNYRHPETPLVLDVEQGAKSLYLITRSGGHGCDEYFRYRHENGSWHDDMLPEIFETRPTNLLIGSDIIDTPSTVSLELKQKKNGTRDNTRYDIRFLQVGPDRCLCGHIGNSNKGGCVQKYNTKKE